MRTPSHDAACPCCADPDEVDRVSKALAPLVERERGDVGIMALADQLALVIGAATSVGLLRDARSVVQYVARHVLEMASGSAVNTLRNQLAAASGRTPDRMEQVMVDAAESASITKMIEELSDEELALFCELMPEREGVGRGTEAALLSAAKRLRRGAEKKKRG